MRPTFFSLTKHYCQNNPCSKNSAIFAYHKGQINFLLMNFRFPLLKTLFIAISFLFFGTLLAPIVAQTAKEKTKQTEGGVNAIIKSDPVKFDYGNTGLLIGNLPAEDDTTTNYPNDERSGAAGISNLDMLKKNTDTILKSKPAQVATQQQQAKKQLAITPKPAADTTSSSSYKAAPAPTPTNTAVTSTQIKPDPKNPVSSTPATVIKRANVNYTYTIREPESIIPQKKLIDKPVVIYPKGANGSDAATYKARLSALPTIIAMDYNDLVAGFITMYLKDKRDQVSRMLSRSQNYMTVFETALDRYGLPMELAYLPVIESALVPHAKNDKGASGLWQLPYSVAKQYGLESNNYIDERRDPVLSSEVAAKHLAYLYKKYTDWHLVIAAYNCGEGAVNKAIKQAGGQRNYWDLSTFLPIEAQAYVPLFIAAVYVMNYYPEHGLYKFDAPYSYYTTDTIRVKNGLNLKNFAINVSMEYDELVFLNPAVIRDTIPPTKRGYPIVLPVSKLGAAQAYINNLDLNGTVYLDRTKEKDITIPGGNIWRDQVDIFGNIIEGSKSSEIENHFGADNNNESAEAKDETKDKKNDEASMVMLEYYVQTGDVLGTIAQKFGCTGEELKKWNNLKTADKLTPLQKLKIWVAPNDQLSNYETIALLSMPLDEKIIQNANKKLREYTIKQGDTLWKIAEKFNVEADRIKKFNGLKSTTLKPGSTLKIPE